MTQTIRIGTRGSRLALYQAELVRSGILGAFPSVNVEIIPIRTTGDNTGQRGEDPFETKRVFTREIEAALLGGEVDVAVHSAKDMAAMLPEGTKIGAVLPREDVRDCLVSQGGRKLEELPEKAVVGTSSLRRRMQLLRWRPDLQVKEIRGNVETRIAKMRAGEFDAVVLAAAGLKRLRLDEEAAEFFAPEKIYPAPGQGCIAVQTREDEPELEEILAPLNHEESAVMLECERAFLRRLEGGCQLPCGISLTIGGKKIAACAALFDLQAGRWAEASLEERLATPRLFGEGLALKILENGGAEIRENIRRMSR